MRNKLTALAILAATITAGAQDITITPDATIIPQAAVQDVVGWLDTQHLYTNVTVVITRIDHETQEPFDTLKTTQEIIPETPQAKLKRLLGEAATEYLRREILEYRKQRAYALADAAVESEPDPVK